MDENLRRAAAEGNVNDLYRLIEEDGNVLKRIDEVEFINTPLHIAVEAGCFDFSMEIMSLKPSFAKKLNQRGLSPIHLAVEKGHKELLLNLMENAKDLVRVKGKKGETPLHYIITREEKHELLHRFLKDCPESVRDLTTENQTALHIAVINNNVGALKILCNMLRNTDYCEDVVNQKDRNGDTALHIAALYNRPEMIKQLLKCKADKHATNLAGLTALQFAEKLENKESMRILRGSCDLPGSVLTFKYKLEKQIHKYVSNASAVIFKDMDSISSEDRNALLVILALLLTVTFQASLSPPGRDDNSSDLLSVTEGDYENKRGKSIMESNFLLFYIPTCAVFIVTLFLTLGLLKPYPRGFRTALQLLLAFLAICFFQSIDFLAPSDSEVSVINLFSVLIFFLMTLMCISYRVSEISVLIIGFWLFSVQFFLGFIGYILVGCIMVVCWLLLFNFDEFWKGAAVGLGFGLFFNAHLWFSYMPSFIFVGLGCWVFFFLHDEFWKGSFFIGGLSVLFGERFALLLEPMIVVGCWLFLSLCRFFLKRPMSVLLKAVRNVCCSVFCR